VFGEILSLLPKWNKGLGTSALTLHNSRYDGGEEVFLNEIPAGVDGSLLCERLL
jgi:hypothetical protein